MNPIESISIFSTPHTPDLGCFVRRKHEFETDQDVDFQNVHTELNPSIDFSPFYHQTYFRVMCGNAAFFQRSLVYMTTDTSIPPPMLQNFPPAFVLGGDYTPLPSDWYHSRPRAAKGFTGSSDSTVTPPPRSGELIAS